MTDKRFTEKQTARILKRAAELQAKSGRDETQGGLSEEEIARIGAEVGLEELHVRAALLEFAAGQDEDVQTRWLGAPPAHEVESIVVGQLDDDAWHQIVAGLNSAFHQSIEGTQAGRVRTWYWKHGGGSINFTAAPADGSVRLKLVAFVDDGVSIGLVVTIFSMIAVAVLVGEGMSGPPWLRVPIGLAAAALVFVWFRKLTSSWFRSDRKKMASLMSMLEAHVASSREPVPAPTATDADEEPLRARLADG